MSLVYSHLLSIYEKRGGIYAVLLDPDKKNHGIIESMVDQANDSDVDVLLVGGSLMMDGKSYDRVKDIKEQSKTEKSITCVGDALFDNAKESRLLMKVFEDTDGEIMYEFKEQ